MLLFTSVVNRCTAITRLCRSVFSPMLLHNAHALTEDNVTKRVPSAGSSGTVLDSLDFDHKTVMETVASYGNNWTRALEFFKWVPREHRFQHSVETYNQMIDILGKFFEFNLAWDLILEMQREGQSPDHVTFRIIFKRYAAAHLVQEAFDAYNRADEFGLKDKTTFLNLFDGLCEYKHVIEAQEFCKETNPGYLEKAQIQNMILRGWYKMGWWSKCREFWEEMEKKGVPRDLYSYSIYMDILSKSGKPWKAVKVYKEMKKKRIKLDIVVYNTVLQSVGLCDGADASLRIYKEMLERGFQPTIVTYNTIIKLFCESGKMRDAYRFLDLMQKNGCDPNVATYQCFFKFLNRPREILTLFDCMLQSGIKPRMETYVMLIKKFGRWGFTHQVFTLWKRMGEHGLSPDGFAYNALIDALLEKGMIDLARKYDEELLAKELSARPRQELGTKFSSEVAEDDIKFHRSYK